MSAPASRRAPNSRWAYLRRGQNSSSRPVEPPQVSEGWLRVFSNEPTVYLVTNPGTIQKTQRHPIIRFIAQYSQLDGNERILEAGCGGGLYGLALASLGCDCVELDISRQMLNNVFLAKSLYEEKFGLLRLATMPGDLNDLSGLQDQFDIVFNEGVIEHWVDQDARKEILSQMIIAAKPGGSIMVCIPNNMHPFYAWWYFIQRTFRSKWMVFRPGGALEEARISSEDLRKELLSLGLEEVVTDGFGVTRSVCYYPRWLILRALAKFLEIVLPPFPKPVREKWGVYLLASGKKPFV